MNRSRTPARTALRNGKGIAVPDLPTGTVTFLFTDIEASTRLIQRMGDTQTEQVFAAHRRLLRDVAESAGGHLYQDGGESFLFVFQRAQHALLAAIAAQRALAIHPWPDGIPLAVRMGIHTGEPALGPDGYVGLDIHRAARLCQAGHGGQILLSHQTQDLVADNLPQEIQLRDLGSHRLKDLRRPERVFEVVQADRPTSHPPLRTLDPRVNNLPIELSRFVGRDEDINQVRRVLSTNRLATLTGPGGIGKTRLAIQVGTEIAPEFSHGVCLVELAPFTDPSQVAQAIASDLHVREQPGRSLAAALSDYLEDRGLLLILDNCEHLASACAHLIDLLLRACPRLRVLTTSQEPLGIAGEIIWRVPPLPLPDLRRLPPLERLKKTEAVHLFCVRADAARPGFVLTDQNARWVAHICHLLDGIPLAIELAAARVTVLSVEQIDTRLEDALRLLTGGSRTILPRHQTLRATMDWSHNQLLPPQRLLLRRLSVFAGGLTLDAAEAICAGDGVESSDVLELLMQLVERSLVMADTQGPAARYRLLETLRQYAREKLREAGEEESARTKHRGWFLTLALHVEPALMGSDERWFDRLEAEHDNFRAALEASFQAGAREEGLRLAAALRPFWQVRGYWTAGRQWLEMLLADGAGTSPPVRAKALNAAGQLAQQQGDFVCAKAQSEESLELYRTLKDTQGIAAALNVLGNVMLEQGDLRGARELHEESLTYAKEAGDPHLVASSLVNLANIADHEGNFDRAIALGEESLAVFRRSGEKRGIAAALHMLGVVAGDRGDLVSARTRFEESLTLRQELGDRRGIAASLTALGRVAGEQGDYASAGTYYDEGLAIRRELGDRRGIAAALYNLGVNASRQEDLPRAAALMEESLVLRHAQGNLSGVAECLEALARITQDPQRTARLLGAAEARREAIGTSLPPAERVEHDRTALAARRALGDDAFASAWNQGRTLPTEQLIQYTHFFGAGRGLPER